jgi:hypothetical protein
MLTFLRGKASERKLRLFAAAYCRRIWHLLLPEFRQAVEVGERYADGRISEKTRQVIDLQTDRLVCLLMDIVQEDENVSWTGEPISPDNREERRRYREFLKSENIPARVAMEAGLAAMDPAGRRNPFDGNTYFPGNAEHATAAISQLKNVPANQANVVEQAECEVQSVLLRDVIGNPFRPAIMAQAWLTWNDGTTRRIGQAIYGKRAFNRMPILADALEDAGCDNANILAHCRGPGPHVRGCWVVDLLQGKS